MNEHDLDWFMENDGAFATLNTEQINTLMGGGTVAYGETESDPEKVLETDTSVSPDAGVKEEAKPVVQARDGVHTIPYSELESAREKAAMFEQMSRDQAALIESLKAAKEEDKGTGETAAQDAVMAEYLGEFPELATDMKPFIQRLIDAGVNAKVSELERKFDAAIKPFQKSEQDRAVDAHFGAIYQAIPDFDVLKNGPIQEWVDTLPSYQRRAAIEVLDTGSTEDVVDLFKAYKATLKQPDVAVADDIKAKADEAIANAKPRTPTTLNDIPAAGSTQNDEEPTSAAGYLAKFSRMSADDIMKELAR